MSYAISTPWNLVFNVLLILIWGVGIQCITTYFRNFQEMKFIIMWYCIELVDLKQLLNVEITDAGLLSKEDRDFTYF